MSVTEKTTKKPETAPQAREGRHGSSNSVSPFGVADFNLQQSAGNLAIQRTLQAGALQPRFAVGRPDDPSEREADRVAEHVVGSSGPLPSIAGSRTPNHARRSPDTDEVAGSLGSGQALAPSVRAFFEPRLGADLGHVRVHTGSRANELSGAIKALAFTADNNIAFANGQYDAGSVEGKKLLGHELTHVLQQRGAVQRQPDPNASTPAVPVCTPPPNASFISPRPAPGPPQAVRTEVQVQSPATDVAHPQTETIVLNEPVLSSTPIVFYAIPIELTSLGGQSNQPPVCVAPPQQTPRREDDHQTQASGAPVSTPAFPGVPKTAQPVSIEGATVNAEVVTASYVLTSQYHHLAVGAGAITILETPQGVRLIDAGVGHDGGSDISDAILDRASGIIGERPIIEVMISHLHTDHTQLLPRLAERFPIGKIRVNALQFADPRFQQLLQDVAASQTRGVRDRAAKEFDGRRTQWERSEGSKIGDAAMRDTAFQNAKAAFIQQALDGLRNNPTTVELFVPDGTKLRVLSAPMGTLPDLTGATSDPISEGVRRTGAAGDISDTAFTDPETGEHLKDLHTRQATDPKARVEDVKVDTASTSYIIDLPGGNRLLVVPDVRTTDLRRPVRDTTGTLRSNLEGELARVGHPARFQAWNMTHHMQSGWAAGGTPHIAGPGDLVAFIKMMQDIRQIQAAQRASGQRAPADMVVVSAQHDVAARSLINPGMAWFLRALGFEVFLATSGRDVRLIEATTAGGRKIAGVSGLPFEGGRPSAPLLMQSEAAIRFIDQKITLQEARKATKGMKKADASALVADRKANLARLRAAKNALVTARDNLITTASREIWRGPDEAKKPAVAPDPATGTPPALAAAEQAVRTAMQAPDLSDFTTPEATEAPVITDTALVLLRLQRDTPLDAQGRQILEINQRLDALRARLLKGENSAELRGQLTADLQTLRNLLKQQIPTAPEASRPTLEEELVHTQRELESLVHSTEGQILFSREPGTGRLIENRVVTIPASPADRMRQRLGTAGRYLGALMLYQTIREQGHLEQQAQMGQVTQGQGIVGTVKNVQGISIAVRMMTAVEVHPLEFVVMSALDFTQAALANYDTPEERAVALTHNAIQGGVSLFLMYLGQVMMNSKNPYLVAAGFGVMLLTQPIMMLLEATGVFDAVERAVAFLPSEVTKANQRLRDLMKEYTAILGALELASRSESELMAIGVSDPAAMKASSQHDVAQYRTRAVSKEEEVLTAFEEAYQRAQTDFAGLYELDTLRNNFLLLRQKVHEGDAAYDDQARTRALNAFARMDANLSMDQFTVEQVNDMPQWQHIDDALSDLNDQLSAKVVNWKAVREKEQELEQMIRNARYRIQPAAFGMRKQPLISADAPARSAYEQKLQSAEARMNMIEAQMTVGAMQQCTPGIVPESGEVTLANIEAMLTGYNSLLDQAPARPFTATDIYKNSMMSGVEYRQYVEEHSDYAVYLERLHAVELGLRSAARRVVQAQANEPPTEAASTLQARIQSASSRRSQELGLLFLDELGALTAATREKEIEQLAPMLGQAPDVRLLSPEEQTALKRGELEDYAKQISTISNNLQQVPGLRIPPSPDDPVGGVYRVIGPLETLPLLITEISSDYVKREDNVLVGITGPAVEEVAAHGHEDAVPVVPLNAAAMRRLGSRRHVWRSQLSPVLLKELTPLPQPAQPGPPTQPQQPTP